ncbi:MAG: phage portal protein [Candidatus Gracilibacteria bacterium]|nr:phage portal protein [Candidatus Gracilibacteria bacterium]
MEEENNNIKIIKTVKRPVSKQLKEENYFKGEVTPKIDFNKILDVYNKSFIASGITDKIASTLNNGFICQDKQLLKVATNFDIEFLVKNLVVCGNAFFEVIRRGDGTIVELVPMLTSTVTISEDGKFFIQKVGTKTKRFNRFTPLKYRTSGYLTSLNEVYHFKNSSLTTSFYGDSLFESIIDQLILVNYIDAYYNSYFENGTIRTNIFTDSESKLSDKDREILTEFFKAKLKGSKNAFSTAIIPAELKKLNLGDEIDTNAFINYRQELLKSIAIRLNIPYDLIISDNSNRASITVAMEAFNAYTIKPIQNRILKDLKNIFQDFKEIETLKFNQLDTKDQLEEAQINEIYLKTGVYTPEEVKNKLKK